jgi:putative ABC transport system substrate-binding protein
VSDIDTAVADSLKVLDLKRPIREADMTMRDSDVRSRGYGAQKLRAAAALGKGNGLIVLPDTFNATNRKTIFALASQYQLPAIYGFRFFVSEGGLMSYGPDFVEMHYRSASYIDRILKGESPANLAIQQPTKLEFLINMKTAKTLGLVVPQTLLSIADELIE